ncbi:single-stranded DNA-binding protein [Xanthomonas euvesicatoria]
MARRTKNKVELIGFVGRDAELQKTGDRQYIIFDIGTTESWAKKDGSGREERTTWNRCIAGGKTAELLARFVKKGAYLQVEGSLSNRAVEKDGETRYYTDIRVTDFIGLDKLERGAEDSEPPEDALPDDFDDDAPF